MSRFLLFLAVVSLGVSTAAQGPASAPAQAPAAAPQYSAALKVGDPAPPFSLQGSDGKTHDLSAYKGKTVVIAWFPKAFTGGCTAECKSLGASAAILQKYDIALFMASVDDLDANTRFAKEHAVTFPILADPSKAVAKSYGVIRLDRPAEQQVAARWTFYIGPDGRIRDIDTSPNTATAGERMVAKLEELGVAKRSAGLLLFR